MIVGRDTGNLDRQGILRATVETIAESMVDGIISPLFYACIGGAPLALAYKAINTLDSMIGHQDETYRDFGKFAARLDDAANWIPARLGGVIIALACFICGFNGRESLKTIWRDGQKHLSPNAGIPEAAVAGGLGIQLGGASFYGGIRIDKPHIGDSKRELALSDITASHKIMFASSGLALVLFVLAGRIFVIH
jgi:adenosylcobinamide-phosphate synthase